MEELLDVLSMIYDPKAAKGEIIGGLDHISISQVQGHSKMLINTQKPIFMRNQNGKLKASYLVKIWFWK